MPLTNGSYRNHCPQCFHSKHVDNQLGDRGSSCHSVMEPIDLTYHRKKGYLVVHRCCGCGKIQKNKIAENTAQPDELMNLLKLLKGD